MDHQLHTARFVEEALQHQVLLAGHHPQHGPAGRQVVDDHGRRVSIDAGCVDQHPPRAVGIFTDQVVVDPAAQGGDFRG